MNATKSAHSALYLENVELLKKLVGLNAENGHVSNTWTYRPTKQDIKKMTHVRNLLESALTILKP